MTQNIKNNSSESDDRVVLSDIYNKNINIAVWKRNLNKQLLESTKHYINNGLSTLTIIVSPQNVDKVLIKEFPDFPFKNYLVKDIEILVDMFCCLFDLKQVGLRIAIINKAMCPRFHIDNVACRLVTSYSGTTTEWLNNNDVDRNLLGKTDKPYLNKNTKIQKLGIGDVALLKGESWIGNSGSGLVHRSPNILNEKNRLLVTIDFA